MNRKPDFIIVGAAKAGTTALYYYLGQHPDIAFPELKEPKYFSVKANLFPHNGPGDRSVDKFVVNDQEAYYKLFSKFPDNKIAGEASPDYLYFHEITATSIRNELGDIPIIIVLRNPVSRAFSAYSYLKRDDREKSSFKEGLALEQERMNKNYDFIWAYKKGGLYAEQVKSFIENFTHVHVMIFEEFLANKQDCISEVFSFLGVSRDFQVDFSVQHNPSGVPNNWIAKFLLSRSNRISTGLREILKRTVPRSLLERSAKKMLVRENITEEDAAWLRSYFKNDIEALETVLEKKLPIWY